MVRMRAAERRHWDESQSVHVSRLIVSGVAIAVVLGVVTSVTWMAWMVIQRAIRG